MTAELECLLDDVLTGRQEMSGAIDAVCDAARRIIGALADRGTGGATVGLGETPRAGDGPPTAAMKRFAGSIARKKGIKPPAGYTKSTALCRVFLDRHAPRRGSGKDEKPARGGESPRAPAKPAATGARRRRRTKSVVVATASSRGGASGNGADTALRIPYGNKEVALGLGARYGAAGWYAPPGVDLAAFRDRGWL